MEYSLKNPSHPFHAIFDGVPGMIRFAFYDTTTERKCKKARYIYGSHLDSSPSFNQENEHAYFTPVTRTERNPKKESSFATRILWMDLDNKIPSSFPDTFEPSFIIRSGNGFHYYWLLDEPVTLKHNSKKEAVFEQALKAIAQHFNGDISPTHTAAQLRIPGSFNPKNNKNIPVTWSATGRTYPVDIINKIAKRIKVEKPKKTTQIGSKNTEIDTSSLFTECPMLESAYISPDSVSEPLWFNILRTLLVLPNGESLAYQISSHYTKFSQKEFYQKVKNAARCKPAGCNQFSADGMCGGCKWKGKVKSPSGIPYKLLKTPSS